MVGLNIMGTLVDIARKTDHDKQKALQLLREIHYTKEPIPSYVEARVNRAILYLEGKVE